MAEDLKRAALLKQRERKEKCCDEKWFGACGADIGERESESCCEEKWLLDMWGVPTKSFQVSVQAIPL
jgi:hypothetical protein